MKNKCLPILIVLILLIYFPPALQSARQEKEKPRKRKGIGVYVGWALGLGRPFDWSTHRYMYYKEGLNFQLGVYKEFSFSFNPAFAIQAEATMQHYYWKYEGTWGYDPTEDVQKGVKSEPVFKFCLNALIKPYVKPGGCYYLLVGAGVRIGEVTMNLYKKTNFHYQFGFGAKFRLKRKFLLNVMARVSYDPSEIVWYDHAISYPGLIVGLEF
jgi:hypothetical protein